MVSDGPEWFAPKRYGLGSGRPISWQGWALLIGFMAVVIGAGAGFGDRPLAALAIIIPAAIGLILVAARTTRGGWRWRWGNRD